MQGERRRAARRWQSSAGRASGAELRGKAARCAAASDRENARIRHLMSGWGEPSVGRREMTADCGARPRAEQVGARGAGRPKRSAGRIREERHGQVTVGWSSRPPPGAHCSADDRACRLEGRTDDAGRGMIPGCRRGACRAWRSVLTPAREPRRRSGELPSKTGVKCNGWERRMDGKNASGVEEGRWGVMQASPAPGFGSARR